MNGQPSTASITTTWNYTPHKNPPNTVIYVPIEPDSDPSFPDYSLSDSSESSDFGYSKQGRRTHKKLRTKGVTTTLLKSKPISHIIYLSLRESTRSRGLKWMSIFYIAGSISCISWIHFKLFYHNLSRLTCLLWTIHS